MATSTAPPGKQNSRFSTLKVFKFAASGSKPPPPPPKDPYYLANPSLASLSLDSFSQPITPVSTYAASARCPSPSPSYSTSRYPPSTRDMALSPPGPTATLSPDSAGSRKGIFKLPSFTRRPKTPKSTKSNVSDDSQPPEPVDDPSISTPWNFQHNIHVDEGFTGLPPTWSTSLASMGFSPEEIAAINARRKAGRSPVLHPIQSTRSESPAPSIPLRTRSGSLQRDMSEVSFSQHSDTSSNFGYSVNTSRQYTESPEPQAADFPQVESRLGGLPGRVAPVRSATAPLPPLSSHAPIPPRAPSEFSSLTSSSKDRPPRTPPRRAYHVANASVGSIHSPPPAYNSSPKTPHASDVVDESLTPPPIDPSPSSDHDHDQSSDDEDSDELSKPSSSTLPTLSFSTAPPRLSIHQDSLLDLSSWSESLFSIIPSEDKKTATPPRASGTPSLSTPIVRSRSSSRSIPPQKPIPLSSLPARKDTDFKSSSLSPIPQELSTPLWDEVMHLVQPGSEDTPDTSPSPATPYSPYTRDTRPKVETDEVDEDVLHVSSSLREKENRDSAMSTLTVTPATIVRDVTVATRAKANVVQSPIRNDNTKKTDASSVADRYDTDRSYSPQSLESHSSGSSGAASLATMGSTASGSRAVTSLTSNASSMQWKSKGNITSPARGDIPYIESSPSPSPLTPHFEMITTATVRKVRDAEDRSGLVDLIDRPSPAIVIDEDLSSQPDELDHSAQRLDSISCSPVTPITPFTPASRYPGWVSTVVEPLKEFIDERTDPRSLYIGLQEIAEGESGSVFAARVQKLPSSSSAEPFVAIKQVALLPSGSSKLLDLERELKLLKGLSHPHILNMSSLYVDTIDDALWIRMELMDRSLADVIALIGEGLVLQEKHMAQVASDVILALDYLRTRGIAHRDLRSDNLLVNAGGLVKLADFSNGVQVSKAQPYCSDPVGVVYWQAPEIRSGPYNALKVDVWSLGATIWEMAEGDPPFSDITDASQLSDRWQSLSQPELYSRSFHDFLQLCSEPSSSRPDPHELLNTPFIRSAGGHSSISELLLQCKAIEGGDSDRRLSTESLGTISA